MYRVWVKSKASATIILPNSCSNMQYKISSYPDIPPQDRKFKSAIVKICSDYCELMITEAELINRIEPKINVYSGQWKLLN